MKRIFYLIIGLIIIAACNNDSNIIETNIAQFYKNKCVEYEGIKTIILDTIGVIDFSKTLDIKVGMVDENKNFLNDYDAQLESLDSETEKLLNRKRDAVDNYALLEFERIRKEAVNNRRAIEMENEFILGILKQDSILLKSKKDTTVAFLIYHRYLCNGEEKKDSIVLDAQFNLFEYKK